MKKQFLPVILIAAVLFTACGSVAKSDEGTVESTLAAPADAAESSTAPVQGTVLDADNPCTPYRFINTLLGAPYPGLPPVTADDFIEGPMDAPVTYIVYSEPQCPYCALFDNVMNDFLRATDKVRVVYRFRPFSPEMHDKSVILSQAMVAANLQGKFSEFKEWIFLHQNKELGIPAAAGFADEDFWINVPPAEINDWLAQRVSELGIDPDQLLKDMVSAEVVQAVSSATESANALGINSTPSLFVDGYKFPANWSEQGILPLITELVLNKDTKGLACPETVIDTTKTYTATLSTSKGDITVDLFADKAINAVNSFVFLARNDWYDDLVILSPEELIVTGDPTGTFYDGPGYAYLDEVSPALNFEEAGMLATFYAEPNRNGSVFLISKKPLPELEGRTIFGKVTSGLDVVTRLEDGDKILDVTIIEK